MKYATYNRAFDAALSALKSGCTLDTASLRASQAISALDGRINWRQAADITLDACQELGFFVSRRHGATQSSFLVGPVYKGDVDMRWGDGLVLKAFQAKAGQRYDLEIQRIHTDQCEYALVMMPPPDVTVRLSL